MSKQKHKKTGRGIRDKPQARSGGVGVWLGDSNTGDILCSGYTSLAHNPEIVAAVDTIARLIGSMTIHLMANTDAGDIRIKDGLSRKVDVDPARGMPRSNFIQWIVKTMFLEGRGNAVVLPQYRQGGKYLDNLQPIPPEMVSFIPDGWSYRAMIAGREYEPDEILHFALNPGSYYPWMGQGYTVHYPMLPTISSRRRRPKRDLCRASGSLHHREGGRAYRGVCKPEGAQQADGAVPTNHAGRRTVDYPR